MGSLVLTGATSGSITVAPPDVAGTNTATIGAATGTHYPFTAGTAAASTSGTSIDFTGIPSWVKRITVMFNGVSTNGTSEVLIQIGTSGGIQTTSYSGAGTVATSAVSTTAYSTGFMNYTNAEGATSVRHGSVILSLLDSGSGIWTCQGNLASSAAARSYMLSGSKTLSGTLDRVRITTVNGTDTFDAGSINILYE